jgi:hypothetical protein
MALPISGAWIDRNANANSFAGATKWGNGSDPVHERYGEGPPLRTTGRADSPTSQTLLLDDVPESFEAEAEWGYTPDDLPLILFSGMPPGWGTEAEDFRGHVDTGLPPWSTVPYDDAATQFRITPEQDPSIWSGQLNSYPTETVSEGWQNKITGGVNDAEVSAPSQYERQTSMQQVNPAAGRNNQAAVTRATDDSRFNIMTRLTGMKIKPWSEGQRNNDMFPFQQELMVRPFWYRTAGTGDPEDMAPNSMVVTYPVQRDVPPDPYLGPEETQVEDSGYGYTGEDVYF